jgi:hypothetical protein
MAQELLDAVTDAMVGAGKTTVIQKNGKAKQFSTLAAAKAWVAKNPGSRILGGGGAQPQGQGFLSAAQRMQALRRPGMAQAQPIRPQGYPQQQGYGQQGYGQQGYGYDQYGQQGYGQQGYPQQGYPQGYGYQQPQYPPMMQAQPFGYQQSGYGYGQQQYPDFPYYPEAPDGPDDIFPEDGGGEFGVAAAVGEDGLGVEAAVGLEQYAQIGFVAASFLVDPWPANIADAAYKMVVAAGLGDAKAKAVLDAIRKKSDDGDQLAQKTWIKFGSVAKLKSQGRGSPTVAARAMASGMAVARPVNASQQRIATQTRKLQEQIKAQRQAQIVRAQKGKLISEAKLRFAAEQEAHAAEVRDLEAQLQRRDWSDETRAQLEDQKAYLKQKYAAALEGELAADRAAQAVATGVPVPAGTAVAAPIEAGPVEDEGSLTPELAESPTSERPDFDAENG